MTRKEYNQLLALVRLLETDQQKPADDLETGKRMGKQTAARMLFDELLMSCKKCVPPEPAFLCGKSRENRPRFAPHGPGHGTAELGVWNPEPRNRGRSLVV